MAGSLEWHLLEAARHLDELAVLRQQLRDGETRFVFNQKIIALVAKIPFLVLEVMAAIHKDESLTGILDGCDLPDLDICRILIKLIKQRVIQSVNEQVVAGKAENVVAWPTEDRLPA